MFLGIEEAVLEVLYPTLNLIPKYIVVGVTSRKEFQNVVSNNPVRFRQDSFILVIRASKDTLVVKAREYVAQY